MSSIKAVTTFLTLAALFSIAFFMAVAISDPLLPTVLSYDLGGMGSQVEAIHATIVKWMVVVFLGTITVWALLFILREERQTVR